MSNPTCYLCCNVAMACGAGNHDVSCQNYRRCEYEGELDFDLEPRPCHTMTDIGKRLCPRHELDSENI
jgi:hypothetical protein